MGTLDHRGGMLKIIMCIVCAITFITGCSPTEYASNEPKQYLKSKNGQDLEAPPSLSSDNLSDFYRLPNQPPKVKLKVSVAPPKIAN